MLESHLCCLTNIDRPCRATISFRKISTTSRSDCMDRSVARACEYGCQPSDPAAPKGQKEIAQGRAKRRPGYIAHWYQFRLGIRPDFLFWLRQGFVLDHRHVESVTSRLTQCEGIVHGDLWVFLKPKVQSLIKALSCSLGREHD